MEDNKNLEVEELSDEAVGQVTGGASAKENLGDTTRKYGSKAGKEAESLSK